MHHRDRAAPVALPRKAPVAQAELGDALAPALRLGKVDGGVDRLLPAGHIESGKVVDPLHLFFLRRDIGGVADRLRIGQRFKGGNHRQVVFPHEIQVALVMRRTAKDRPGAIVHQDEIRDPDRQLPIRVQRMAHGQASVEAQLLGRLQRLFRCAALAAKGAELLDLWPRLGQCLGQRVVGRDADERRAHQRVGAGGIDLDGVEILHRLEGHLQPARLADPVFLHQAHLGGPVVQPVERGQQFVGHVGDAEEPLGQLAAFDLGAGSPALAVDHLLVGKHRHVDRVPVHHGVLAGDETGVEHVDEQRLLLAVVFRIAGRELAAPVDRQTQRLHLRAHVGDVLVGPVLGVAADGHGGVLGRHPESVPAHRVQHVVPGRQLVARDHVAHRVVAHVAHMDAPRRIGEHLEHIVFRLAAIEPGAEQAGLVPGLLPLGFDVRCGISRHAVQFLEMNAPGEKARRHVGGLLGERARTRACGPGCAAAGHGPESRLRWPARWPG